MRAPSPRPAPTRSFRAALALASASAALALSPAPLPAAPAPATAQAQAQAQAQAAPRPVPKKSDPEVARLRAQVERLRSEQRLAAGKAFYLRLDASGSRLALMLQGVALDDYAALSVEWGVPEVFFVNRSPGTDWDEAAFSKGCLEPERERDRVLVVAPAPAAAGEAPEGAPSPSPPPVPKSAEELYSVPSPYRVVFAEGISLEVRAKGDGGRNRSLFQRAADALRLRLSDIGTAVGLGAKERVRLRVTLYRSLPPDVGLVVIGLPSR
jgi:hypothetical protein